MRRVVLVAALAALVLTACTSLPGSGRNIGVVEDPNLRAYLRPLALVEDLGCTLTTRARPLAMRCRVFEGPAGERIVAAYDLVTDRVLVVMLLHPDGRQEVLWLPTQRERAGEPEVML